MLYFFFLAILMIDARVLCFILDFLLLIIPILLGLPFFLVYL